MTEGMHSAFLVAACVAGAGSLVALVLVKSPGPAKAEQAATPQ